MGGLITLKFSGVNAVRSLNQDMSAVLDSHTHSNRNIRVVRQDLFPLPVVAESNRDKRLPSATINTFGASIQDLFDGSDEGADFCIFTSWLAVLADGKVSENDEKNVGTFGDHVMRRASTRSYTMFAGKFSANKSLFIWNKGGNPSLNSLSHTTLFR